VDHNYIDYIADRWFGLSGHSQGFMDNKQYLLPLMKISVSVAVLCWLYYRLIWGNMVKNLL